MAAEPVADAVESEDEAEVPDEGAEQGVEEAGADSTQDVCGPCAPGLAGCWLRCSMPNCRRWRLVDPKCLPALRQDRFRENVSEGEVDWKAWGRRIDVETLWNRRFISIWH